ADDARVLERAEVARLLEEAGGARLVLGVVEQLDRDAGAVEPIAGAEDPPHPADPDQLLELEPPSHELHPIRLASLRRPRQRRWGSGSPSTAQPLTGAKSMRRCATETVSTRTRTASPSAKIRPVRAPRRCMVFSSRVKRSSPSASSLISPSMNG